MHQLSFTYEPLQASCALEFELDLVRVYMDMESKNIAAPGSERQATDKDASTGDAEAEGVGLGRKAGLQAFVTTLLAAACRAKRQACRQDRERVIRDAGFDSGLSSKWVVVSDGGQLVSSAADNGHSHSLLRQCLRRGTWSWELALERESSGDETTCVGVAVNPVTNSCYEDSHQVGCVHYLLLWLHRLLNCCRARLFLGDLNHARQASVALRLCNVRSDPT